MTKIKISAVSYLNTIPFIYGIENTPKLLEKIELSKDFPSECARKLVEDEVDIGLIPVAAIPHIESPHIITDYCIGAIDKVYSVMLYSDVPLVQIETILLDYQSKTSIRLCQLLCEKYWKITPQYQITKKGFETKINGTTAGVVIGDRTFNMPQENTYTFDLAEEWHKWTNYPFVFAAWVANKALPVDFIVDLGKALQKGIDNIGLAVKADKGTVLTQIKKKEYLTKSISYDLDDQKKKGLNLFLDYIQADS